MLSKRQISTLTEPGRYADGGNLYLRIAKGGSKSWVLMFSRTDKATGRKKQTEIGLGSATGKGKAGIVTLDMARRRALAIHAQIGEGKNPLAEKRAAATTFGRIADELVASRKAGWGPSTIAAYSKSLGENGHAKALRDHPVGAIDAADIVAVLSTIWLAKPATAKKVREHLEAVFDYAIAKGRRSAPNPAAMKGNLDTLLPQRPRLTRGHHPAVPYGRAPEFYGKLADEAAETTALRLICLTVTRTEQTTLARRKEFDLDADIPVWTIPAGRNLKSRTKHRPAVPHQVPLVGEALAIAKRICTGLDADDLLFPTLADGALLNRLRSVAGFEAYDVHGLRSTYRDWGGDRTEFPREVLEGAYGHAITKNEAERAYRRSKPIEKHREVFLAWDRHLTGAGKLKLVA